MNYRNEWLNSCFSTRKVKTATVYKNGNEFAKYSYDVAFEVAKDIHGEVVDDETGEIIFSEELNIV